MNAVTKIGIGNLTSVISFVLGTSIFLAYVITESDRLFLIGYYFIVIAGIVNLIVLLWLLLQTSSNKSIKRGLVRSRLLILANIPIATIYIFIVLTILSYLRITFVNKTGEIITNIRVEGCDDKLIDHLNPNDEITKWIGINGDCSVNINYTMKEIEKQETVVGYATSFTGQKLTYNIGSNLPTH